MTTTPTVLVLGRRKTDNMPSLTRMREILRPAPDTTPGMDATVSSSVRVTGARTCDPVMNGCPMGGACVADPIGQAAVDQCPAC